MTWRKGTMYYGATKSTMKGRIALGRMVLSTLST